MCRLEAEAAEKINVCRRSGGRVVAVGTTSVRTLEQAGIWSRQLGADEMTPVSGWAELLILPGYTFQMVDAMITNFHLPPIDDVDDGNRLCREEIADGGVSRGDKGEIPLLQLWRRYANHLKRRGIKGEFA